MSINGDQLNGRDYSTKRDYSMTVTEPPADYRWRHYTINMGQGKDSTVSPLAQATLTTLMELRLAYLDQFEMEVTEEGAHRYWRWYDEDRSVRWWERRPVTDPLPKQPGLWPNNG